MDEFLDIKELSHYLKIKISTLYAKVAKGEIPHYKIGRLVRFKKTEIDKWLESQNHNSVDITRKVNKVLASLEEAKIDIDRIIGDSVDTVVNKDYSTKRGKPGEVRTSKGGV